MKGQDKIPSDNDSILLTGKVIYYDDFSSMEGVSVMSSIEYGCVTDKDGVFEFVIPRSNIKPIEFSFIGCTNMKIYNFPDTVDVIDFDTIILYEGIIYTTTSFGSNCRSWNFICKKRFKKWLKEFHANEELELKDKYEVNTGIITKQNFSFLGRKYEYKIMDCHWHTGCFDISVDLSDHIK